MPEAVRYNVHYGTGSLAYTNVVTATNTTVEIIGLKEALVYYFAATAVDDTGLESDFSNEVTWRAMRYWPLSITKVP